MASYTLADMAASDVLWYSCALGMALCVLVSGGLECIMCNTYVTDYRIYFYTQIMWSCWYLYFNNLCGNKEKGRKILVCYYKLWSMYFPKPVINGNTHMNHIQDPASRHQC